MWAPGPPLKGDTDTKPVARRLRRTHRMTLHQVSPRSLGRVLVGLSIVTVLGIASATDTPHMQIAPKAPSDSELSRPETERPPPADFEQAIPEVEPQGPADSEAAHSEIEKIPPPDFELSHPEIAD